MINPASAPILGYDGALTADVQQDWLDVVWRQLQREDRGLVARITAGDIDALTVADVIASATRRVLRNPDGRESESGSIDDYQESWKNSDATQDVYFTAAELRRLLPVDVTAGGWSGSSKYC